MRGVYARTIATQMVEVHPLGDRADDEFVGDAMSAVPTTRNAKLPIPVELYCHPDPAVIGGALIDVAPKSLLSRQSPWLLGGLGQWITIVAPAPIVILAPAFPMHQPIALLNGADGAPPCTLRHGMTPSGRVVPPAAPTVRERFMLRIIQQRGVGDRSR